MLYYWDSVILLCQTKQTFSMSKSTKKGLTESQSDNIYSAPTLFELSPVSRKPIEVGFTGEQVSVDAGLLLLKEIENKIGIIDAIAGCIQDDRHPSYV